MFTLLLNSSALTSISYSAGDTVSTVINTTASIGYYLDLRVRLSSFGYKLSAVPSIINWVFRAEEVASSSILFSIASEQRAIFELVGWLLGQFSTWNSNLSLLPFPP